MTLMTLMMALSAPALAGHAPALLEVDNDFDGELEIYVDSRFEGVVGGDTRARFDVKPGRRDVRLQRPNGGAVLASTSVHFSKGVTSIVVVDPPLGRLRVSNPSPVPLLVDVGPGDGVWITPGTAVELRVTTGRVTMEARAREAGHIERVTARELWVEPGQVAEQVLDYKPTAHTRLSLKNKEPMRLRAVVDGVEVGWVEPFESRSVMVSPGTRVVRFYDPHGRLVTVIDARAERGAKTVVVAKGSPAPPAHERPSPHCDGRGGDSYALR